MPRQLDLYDDGPIDYNAAHSMARRFKSGEDLCKAREKLGLSQQDVAQLARVSLASISRWEREEVVSGQRVLILWGLQAVLDDYRQRKG